MRFMLMFRLPTEEGNILVKEGRIGPTLTFDESQANIVYVDEVDFSSDTERYAKEQQ